MLEVITTAYGRPASECLHGTVARAKAGDPLAPVTVVVPTNSVGVAARRRLASGALGALTERGAGVVGVTFLTVFRLAELLGASRLAAAGRRPVSTPVVAAAVRAALAADAGVFSGVAAHPATEEALVAVSRELADLDEAQLDRLAGRGARAATVVRVHRAVRARLAADWYDEADLMQSAVDALAAGSPLVDDLGRVVCFMPQRLSVPATRLLHALGAVGDLTVIVALTGVPAADAAVVAGAERLDPGFGARTAGVVEPPVGTAVRSASDADDEVRMIVRGVVDAMRAGVPLERMAVLHGTAEPYARLVHEHLDAAGIPHNGAAVRTLAGSVFGRALMLLLGLGAGDFRRDDVCALFAAAPVLDGEGRPVPAAAWERISRRAGVVSGLDQWRDRLDAYAAGLGTDDWHTRERARVEALRAFVERLAQATRTDATTWDGLAAHTRGLARRFLGDDRRRARWPQAEQDAAHRVEAALERLATLDTVDPAPTREAFVRTLQCELDAALDRVGRLGEGLLAGPTGLALGVDLDRVWVCGLAEGVFPAVPNDDPLLADAERELAGGGLRLRRESVDEHERGFLAALAATEGARVCTWPRGDLRRTTERVPSRFVLPTIAAVGPGDAVASYLHGLVDAEFPSGPHERAVVGALAGEDWVRRIPEVARGHELRAARAGAVFTRFDGNLAGLGDRLARISPRRDGRAVSPTRLETWAGCPHAFFMQYVLHVEPIERPEEILAISPLDRGSIVHEVLDEFLADGPRERARLHDIAARACARAEAQGLTGRSMLWHRDRRRILADLDAFFAADEEWRAARGAETVATEMPFGMREGGLPPVEVAFADGRPLRLRGLADRVDRTGDGGVVVVDYKTGAHEPYRGLTPDDPVAGGTRLQLPVYARAARAAYASAAAPVAAYYWFVGRGDNRLIGYAVDESVDAAFDDAVTKIVTAIEGGVFVAVPPKDRRGGVGCAFCDPDGFGTALARREWERMQRAPELQGCAALAYVVVPAGPPDGGADGGGAP